MTDREKIEKIKEYAAKKEKYCNANSKDKESSAYGDIQFFIDELDETESTVDIQQAFVALRKELMKKGDIYTAFLTSLASGIKDCIAANSKRNEHGVYKVEFSAGDLAIAGLNRVIGKDEGKAGCAKE